MTDGRTDGRSLMFATVRAERGELRGLVIEDDGSETVRVRWIDGSTTESRRALLVVLER